MILKAKYDYRSGNVLLLPKTGFSPGLFLEFIRDNINDTGTNKIRLQISDSSHESESDYFVIRAPHVFKETFLDAVEYINNNIPKD